MIGCDIDVMFCDSYCFDWAVIYFSLLLSIIPTLQNEGGNFNTLTVKTTKDGRRWLKPLGVDVICGSKPSTVTFVHSN